MNQNDGSAPKNTTYAQCYGIKASYISNVFTSRSALIKKHWIQNSENQSLKLGGHWKDNSYFATQENYFTVNQIDGVEVSAENVQQQLIALSKQTLIHNGLEDYAENIAYFANETSIGWEYPAINELEQEQLYTGKDIFSYAKILRYAFASSYAYNLENPGQFDFIDNKLYQSLMLVNGELNIIREIINVNGVYAVAIKVPAIPNKGLEEEIIIAYKGTDNPTDVLEDIKLALANLIETDHKWQKTAYDFCRSIIEEYPPNAESVASGYQRDDVVGHNIVLTGHSLGAYTAIDSGVRTGIQTRVFSSPGTKIIESISKALANTMWLRNVINFRRNLDPVSSSLMRHDENEVEFPAKSKLNPIQNHFLTPFINELLLPLAQGDGSADLQPQQLFITANATVGAGLKHSVNHWGKQTLDVTNKKEDSLAIS